MQFRFDAHQEYQQRAVASVADLFRGLRRADDATLYQLKKGGFTAEVMTTRFELDPARLLANVRAVQTANNIPADDELKLITETVDVADERQKVAFPNVSVEMETGTGKTYVYLRTAFELNKRYGLRKFIVVVPSVAVREGVLKTFQVTRGHFDELFENEPYRFDVYDSRNLTRLRDFAEGEGVRFLVMTIDSFNKDTAVIRQRRDRLQGRVGLHLLQAVRPVIILDEPQNMESALRKQALATLNPLAALRYSATHRDKYNLVYRLTPYAAYRQGLVKKVEVAAVVEADSHNAAFVRVEGFAASSKAVTAKIAIHQRMADGAIKEKKYQFKPGDCLAKKAKRSEYEPFVVDEIDKEAGTVSFTNGVTLKLGSPHGADQAAVFRAQVRYTIERHFRRQRQLDDDAAARGAERIKVLSLFFIDKVDNYTAPDGLIRTLFDEEFDNLKAKYPAWAKVVAATTRGAYFAAKRKKGGAVEFQDSTTGDNAEDRAAYALIMREKERLLSFAEPVCFLFSHSALKEGWDNPNVFQICTLNQTASELKKRQEIGRGMRLAVDATGARTRDEAVNVLTVVANESYEDYVKALQKEIASDFGDDEAEKCRPTPADRTPAVRKPMEQFPPEFAALWERIKHKTRYNVAVDTAALVAHVVDDLNLKLVAPPRVEVTLARVEARSGDVFRALQVSQARAVATLVGRFPLPNVVERIAELLAHTAATPVRLTRATILKIVAGVRNQDAVLDNPNEFATVAAAVIREKLEEELVHGIRYEKDGTWYEQTLFEAEIATQSDKVIDSPKSLYDRLVYQSNVERDFAAALEDRADVRFYVKLPRKFVVKTPIGEYNPDWALVMEETDEFGAKGERVYLVRETKGAAAFHDLTGPEKDKLRCGARHFNDALGCDFKWLRAAAELPGGTDVR
jgi:type III restriction enzyme